MTPQPSRRLIQRAPGASSCCDPAGRMCALAARPIEYAQLIGLAVTRGEGTFDEIRARVADMLAGGLLIESEG